MLSMILAILKIIGILLALILLILLLVVLALLFVPFRYRIDAEKTGSLDEAEAKVSISWFLGAAAFYAAYQKKEFVAHLRILWIKKPLTGEKEEDAVEEEEYSLEDDGYEKESSIKQQQTEKDIRKEESEEPQTERQKVIREKIREADEAESVPTKKKKSIFGRILKRLQRWMDAVKRLPEKLKNLRRSFQKKWKKLRAWIAFLRSELTAEAIKILKGHLFYLLRHIKPRVIKGWLHFGMEDPADTGQITGVLYLLLPVSCSQVDLQPDFTQKVLEGNLHIKGHIRMVHLGKVAIQILLDRKLKLCWKRIKKLRRK